jgi:hypothetical protein
LPQAAIGEKRGQRSQRSQRSQRRVAVENGSGEGSGMGEWDGLGESGDFYIFGWGKNGGDVPRLEVGGGA